VDRNTGLIATIATTILCGCPGLFSCFWGSIASLVSFVPGAEIDIGGSSDPMAALVSGLVAIVIGFVLVAIPVAVWFFLVRGKAAA
jgi:hypothetical protein